jgi:hypothetical protein
VAGTLIAAVAAVGMHIVAAVAAAGMPMAEKAESVTIAAAASITPHKGDHNKRHFNDGRFRRYNYGWYGGLAYGYYAGGCGLDRYIAEL